ncbi:MAG: hypothetical protein WA970_07315 [Gammaproteobacteria bacterium]
MAHTRELTLFVPGLLGPASAPAEAITEGLAVPALEQLFSYGEPFGTPWIGNSLEGWLCQLLDFAPAQGEDWPVAALTYAFDAEASADHWYLRADPVHLRADLTKLVLLDASALSLSRAEAEALAGEINAHYQAQAWRLEVAHPARWYVRLHRAPRICTQPMSAAMGAAELAALLPEGDEAPGWRRRLNEIQMLLHASPINEAREARGALPVNSVWFWGGGRLPPAPKVAWQQLWSRDSLSAALARHVGIGHEARPETAAQWLDRAAATHHLMIFEQGDALCRRFDIEGWRAYVDSLHRDWCLPLVEALRQRRLHRLALLTESGEGFYLTPSLLRRWWRRRRPLRQFMAARFSPHEAPDHPSRP